MTLFKEATSVQDDPTTVTRDGDFYVRYTCYTKPVMLACEMYPEMEDHASVDNIK